MNLLQLTRPELAPAPLQQMTMSVLVHLPHSFYLLYRISPMGTHWGLFNYSSIAGHLGHFWRHAGVDMSANILSDLTSFKADSFRLLLSHRREMQASPSVCMGSMKHEC